MLSSEVGQVDFKTLGHLWTAWIERHCRVPDRHERGKPFVEYDWQFWISANEGRIREDAAFDPDDPPLNQAFVYRRSQVIAPQKIGKGPWTACHVCLDAVGPSEFAGWAAGGEVYLCSDFGCPCGWGEDYDERDPTSLPFEFEAGDPLGMRHPSPLIQIAATSEEQVANIWRPLTSMIGLGPLKELLLPRGEFIRIVGESGDKDMDRIDRVTASAKSRLGAPISRARFDESGLFTEQNGLLAVADTMRRGAAGMGGRTSETTNMFDPSERSYAQRTMESESTDVFRFWRDPDKVLRKSDGSALSFRNKADRGRILRLVYEGSTHVNINSIDAEAVEIAATDLAQAERFFGNREVMGSGAWADVEKWKARSAPRVQPPKGTQVVLGFDGSDVDDVTGIRAETQDGYQFTPITDAGPTIWNPADFDGQVPRTEVNEAMDWLFTHFDVIRLYPDPPYWTTECDAWEAKYGEKRVIRWYTSRPRQTTAAADRLLTDVAKSDSGFTHDGCETTAEHIGNARKIQRPGASNYKLAKPSDGRKIDMAIPSILAHEAAGDATAAKLWRRKFYAYAE